jgi:sugar/nucleoside kinase (ribokinase family)
MPPPPSSISSSETGSAILRPLHLLAAVALGVVIYLIAFTFILSKPLTTDTLGAYIDFKSRYLESIALRRKILIFAGSNGRFSHRCETITMLTGIACANLSIAVDVDLRWQMSHYWRFLKKGDVLYMPIEYGSLLVTGATVGEEAPYVVRHDHASLALYGATKLPFALFYFDFRYLIAGIGETLLSAAGVQRRNSVSTLTEQGDERDTTPAKAAPYRSFVDSIPADAIASTLYDDPSSAEMLHAVIQTARAKGVIVVGGLPTTFDEAKVPGEMIDRMRAIFVRQGACFVVLPNHSLYPREAFFDSEYHLQEPYQIAHSELLAPILARISTAGSCPAY